MVLRTLFKNQRGFTAFELVITLGLISLLFLIYLLVVDPVEAKKRAHDNKRLSDISMLDRAVSEYAADNNSYPTTLVGLVGAYINKVPVDPTNSGVYVYSYATSSGGYELNAVMEYLTSEMANDGGNNANKYEVGNNLTIIP